MFWTWHCIEIIVPATHLVGTWMAADSFECSQEDEQWFLFIFKRNLRSWTFFSFFTPPSQVARSPKTSTRMKTSLNLITPNRRMNCGGCSNFCPLITLGQLWTEKTLKWIAEEPAGARGCVFNWEQIQKGSAYRGQTSSTLIDIIH